MSASVAVGPTTASPVTVGPTANTTQVVAAPIPTVMGKFNQSNEYIPL